MLPPLINVGEVHKRLRLIFPEGAPQRTYCTREMAARTVFVMLYIGAIEGDGIWMAPKYVYRMGPAQSTRRTDDERHAYAEGVLKRDFVTPTDRWFQDNTREPIRDETLRDGLVQVGAVVTRPGLPTTSSKGRYALQNSFASLFDPGLDGDTLATAVATWQDRNLSFCRCARPRAPAAPVGCVRPIEGDGDITKWRNAALGSGTVFRNHESGGRDFRT